MNGMFPLALHTAFSEQVVLFPSAPAISAMKQCHSLLSGRKEHVLAYVIGPSKRHGPALQVRRSLRQSDLEPCGAPHKSPGLASTTSSTVSSSLIDLLEPPCAASHTTLVI